MSIPLIPRGVSARSLPSADGESAEVQRKLPPGQGVLLTQLVYPSESVQKTKKRHSLRHAVSVLRISAGHSLPFAVFGCFAALLLSPVTASAPSRMALPASSTASPDGIASIVHAFADVITDGIRVGVAPLINSVVGAIVGAIAVSVPLSLLLLPQPQTNSIVSAASRAISFS